MKNLISKESLEAQGWKFFSEFKGLIKGYKKGIERNGRTYWCEIKNDSNTPGRDWFVHVDGPDFDTVGSMDIATFDQLERFLDLLTE